MAGLTQTLVITGEKAVPGPLAQRVSLVNPDGTPFGGGKEYVLPAATASALGGVKKASAVAEVSAADATSAASSETVDPAEFAALVTLANALKAAVNGTISAITESGAMGD